MRVQYDRFGPFFWVHFDTRLYFHFTTRCSFYDIHFLGLLWQLGLARNQFLLSRRLQIRLQYYSKLFFCNSNNRTPFGIFPFLLDCCSNKNEEEDKSCWLSKVLFIEKKERQRWGKKIMPPMRSGHFHHLRSWTNENQSKSWARGIRKIIKCSKSMTKSSQRNFCLKSCEEYLIYWNYFV